VSSTAGHDRGGPASRASRGGAPRGSSSAASASRGGPALTRRARNARPAPAADQARQAGTGGGHSPADRRRRELSQNYLRNPEAVRRFLRSVRPQPDGLCLEVGAGEGVLTARLAAMFGEVIAYEVDANLAGRLTARVSDRGNVQVVLSDFLAARPPARPFQVVGNAPFSVTSAIVDWCLRAPRLIAATLITQREYARKRTGSYGRWTQLTVSTWPRFTWELKGTIARTEFRPVPRVDAAILRLERRAQPLISPARQASYRRLVQAGFSGIGGSVQASLRRSYPPEQVAAACASAGVDRRAVVAYVSPDQWVQIFLALDSGSRQQPRREAQRRGTVTAR